MYRACSREHSSCAGLQCDGGLNIRKEAWVAHDKHEERALGAPALRVLKTTVGNFDSFNRCGFWSKTTPCLQCCSLQSC